MGLHRSWFDNTPVEYRTRITLPTAVYSPDGEPWPRFWQRRLERLMNEYVAICVLAKADFPILSGYRTDTVQILNGYAPHRETHTQGYALDLSPLPGWTIARMAAVARIRQDAPDSRLTGVGIYPNWLHIDIVPRRRKIKWTVRNPKNLD